MFAYILVLQVDEFSREGYKIRYIFGQKSTYSKEIIVVSSRLKLGIILENKEFLKFKLSKISINKDVPLKLYCSMQLF